MVVAVVVRMVLKRRERRRLAAEFAGSRGSRSRRRRGPAQTETETAGKSVPLTETVLRTEPATGRPARPDPRPAQPVWGWVGVVPLASRLSNPSGMDSIPGAVPDTSVIPYCQTMESVVGSMTTTRLR